MNKLIINQENTLNAEILWRFRMVLTQESYNSYNYSAPLFQQMFAGHELAGHFSLGKTKSRYIMLYCIVSEFKKMLLYDVNQSPFFSISFEKSLNSELQMCQMDVALRFWNKKKDQEDKKYYDSQFLTHPSAKNLVSCLETSMN